MSVSLKDLIKFSPEIAVQAAKTQLLQIQAKIIGGSNESDLVGDVSTLKWIAKAASCEGGETFLANDVLPLLEMKIEALKLKE